MTKRKDKGNALDPTSRLWAAMNELHVRVMWLEMPWYRRLQYRYRAWKMRNP
jgi:hypothetical protein